MGDRARAKWAERWGCFDLSAGELGPHLTQCRSAVPEAYGGTKWHLDPSSRLVTQ